MSSGDAYLDGVSVTDNITKVRHTMFSTTEHCMSYLSYILCDTDNIQVSIT
jgi:DUF1365 family protein